jgi:hypothetical protein
MKSYLLEGRPFISLCSFQGTRTLRRAFWQRRAGFFRESLKTEQWQDPCGSRGCLVTDRIDLGNEPAFASIP